MTVLCEEKKIEILRSKFIQVVVKVLVTSCKLVVMGLVAFLTLMRTIDGVFLNIVAWHSFALEKGSCTLQSMADETEYLTDLLDVEEHRLGPGVNLPTDGAGAPTCSVLLPQMPVESLDEGGSHITHVALPRLVVLVVPVHVVHQTTEAPALLVTELTDTEFPVIL